MKTVTVSIEGSWQKSKARLSSMASSTDYLNPVESTDEWEFEENI